MALIAMAVYDTPGNNREQYTRRTLDSLIKTVDFSKHRIFIVVNESTETGIADIYEFAKAVKSSEVIVLEKNVGTARAINKAWAFRAPGENAIKMDNDVVIHQSGWVEALEDCISRDPKIGIVGLKRKDCIETPWTEGFYRSTVKMLPHKPGEPWRIVEEVNHVIGTCQMYSSALLDKIGYLYQPGLYGFDDVLAAVRCQVAGFYNCFYPHIEIDHIDPGDNPYQGWKVREAWKDSPEHNRLKEGYKSGAISIYYDQNCQQ